MNASRSPTARHPLAHALALAGAAAALSIAAAGAAQADPVKAPAPAASTPASGGGHGTGRAGTLAQRRAALEARMKKVLLEMERIGQEVAYVRDGHIVLVHHEDEPVCAPPGPRPSLARQPVDPWMAAHAWEVLAVAVKDYAGHHAVDIDEAEAKGSCWKGDPPPPPAPAPAPAPSPAPAPAPAPAGK